MGEIVKQGKSIEFMQKLKPYMHVNFKTFSQILTMMLIILNML